MIKIVTFWSIPCLIKKEMLRAAVDEDFQVIYKALMQVIYNVSYNIVREADAAEDICHDSLIKMSEKQMEFPSLDDAKYWLIRVARNASLNYVKRRARERKAYAKAFKEDTRKAETGEEAVLKKETINYVQDAMEKLPKNLRAVLQLKEYGSLNYKEIGSILGITEGNVKVRVFRAREQLSKYMGENDVYMPG